MNNPAVRPTATIEDYLGIIYVMERDGEPIIAARLAESLEVSAPTVTMTLKRMVRDGVISLDGHKEIHLTELGAEQARSLIRRHMLTEWMLARMLHVPWSRVHQEAHHIEHTISDDLENRMQDNLNEPQLCPHGNPLPGYEYVVSAWLPLASFAAGQRLTIRRIHETAEENTALMDYLEQHGIFPGVSAQVVEVLAFNQTLTLRVGEQDVPLGLATAQLIFAEPEITE